MPGIVSPPDSLRIGHGRGGLFPGLISARPPMGTIVGGSPPPSGPVLVQEKAGNRTAITSLAVIFDALTTPGNSLFAIITHTVASNTFLVQADDLLSTNLTLAGTSVVNGAVTEIWYVHGALECTSISIGVDSTDDLTMTIAEFEPLNNAAEEDYDSGTGTLDTSVTTNSVTPTSARNVVIAAVGFGSNDYSAGPTNGFTPMDSAGGAAAWQRVAYLSQGSATPQSTGWTLTTGAAWASAIAVFGAP